MNDCYQCIEFGFDPDCWCQDDGPTQYGTKQHTRRYQRGEHVMNKNEATVMRRLQSETGLSEDEVRSHKKYRVMLSEAQTAKGPGTPEGVREAKRILKRITRNLKLAKQHPDTVAAAMKAAEEYNGSWRSRWLPLPMTHYMSELLHSR